MKRPSARLILATLAVAFVTAAPATAAVPSAVRTAAIPAACSPGAAACPIRISFERGAYSGQRTSSLSGINDVKWFVVNARAGQTMIVIVEGAGATRGTVYYPNGQQNGQPGGRVFDDNLPVSGNYRIRVTESSMGQAWSGRVTVVVVIY